MNPFTFSIRAIKTKNENTDESREICFGFMLIVGEVG
jgi:hypothetical protein